MTNHISHSNGSPLGTYAELLLRLDRMMAAGEGDSHEADALRDIMEVPWYQMKPEELEIARQLSADLYTLHDDPLVPHPRDSSIYTPELAADVAAAVQRGNHLSALRLIQQRSAEISAERAAHIRGFCYERLGLIDVSLEFLRQAVHVSDDPERFRAYLLAKLGAHGRIAEGVAAAEQFFAEPILPTIATRKLAASLYLQLANLHHRNGALHEQSVRKAEALCQSILEEVGEDYSNPTSSKDVLDCLTLLVNCYFLLGQRNSAIECETRAIQFDSSDSSRYVVRGMLRWTLDSSAAIDDFQRAIELGTQHPWPYYYLAVDALKSGDFARCIAMASAGARRTTNFELLAKLHEWIAIGLSSQAHDISELPVERIRSHFKLATMFAPESQHILANYRAFEVARENAQLETNWQIGPTFNPSLAMQQLMGSNCIVPTNAPPLEYVS